jgi:hypothetical protein
MCSNENVTEIGGNPEKHNVRECSFMEIVSRREGSPLLNVEQD